jgi:hypothetical protein
MRRGGQLAAPLFSLVSHFHTLRWMIAFLLVLFFF